MRKSMGNTSSIQLLSHIWLFATPWTATHRACLSITPGFPVHHQLLELAQTHIHWVSDAIQSSHPLSSPSPAFNLSQHQGLLPWVTFLHLVAKVLDLQLQHQSFQRIFRLTSLGWIGLISLVSKGLSTVFSSYSLKALILRHSVFFIVQLSHPYMTTGKTIALTICTFVCKVISLLFNMLSKLVKVFFFFPQGTSIF